MGKGRAGRGFFRSPIVRFFQPHSEPRHHHGGVGGIAAAVAVLGGVSITTGTGRVWVNGLLNALSLLIILYLVRKDENSAYKVGWIALIGILPLLGGALYLAFWQQTPGQAPAPENAGGGGAHKKTCSSSRAYWTGLDAREQGQSRYVAKYGPYPAWQNTTHAVFCLRRSHVSAAAGRSGKRLKRASFWNFSS